MKNDCLLNKQLTSPFLASQLYKFDAMIPFYHSVLRGMNTSVVFIYISLPRDNWGGWKGGGGGGGAGFEVPKVRSSLKRNLYLKNSGRSRKFIDTDVINDHKGNNK